MVFFLLILIVLLLICSGIISASETSITSISIVKLRSHIKSAKKYKKISKKVFLLLKNYNRVLMSILLVNTLINSAIVTIFTILISILFLNLPDATLAIISTVVSTVIILFLGEIVPKLIAKRHSEFYFLRIATFLHIIFIVFYPLLWWTKYLEEGKNKDNINEKELLELVNIISDEGILEIREKELVKSAIKFDDKKLKSIMIKKENVKFLYHDSSKFEIINFYKNSNYSRVLVVHRISNKVVGIIHIKDVLKLLINSDKELSISNLIRQPLFMYGNIDLDNALKIMQEKQNHIAVIISNDKKNTFLGIVTLEDLIEQIIGKIYDEYDNPGKIKEVGHSKWILSSDVNIYNFFVKYLNINLTDFNKDLTITQWFILKSRKIIKTFVDLDNNKIIFRNYLFISKIIDNDRKDLIFEVELLKNNKKKH